MAEDSVAIVAIVVILVIVAGGLVYVYRDKWLGVRTVKAIENTIIEKQTETNTNTTIIREGPTKEKETIRERIIIVPQNSTNSSY